MNVKDNRSFWFYLLLTFLTCGLYSIYFWYVYVEDLNTIFYGDGEDSPNYIIVLLLSWVTCGIYGVYWRYKQANRMYRESYDRYGVMIEENGSAILLWTLLGYLTGGIGQLVACILSRGGVFYGNIYGKGKSGKADALVCLSASHRKSAAADV